MKPQPDILIISDDEALAGRLARCLEAARFGVSRLAEPSRAPEALTSHRPALILLDLDLARPDVSPLELCRTLRSQTEGRVPIVIVSAKGGERDRVAGLEAGADDYVLKPVSEREMALRLRAVLRRCAQAGPRRQLFQAGGLSVDLESYRVVADGREVRLARREFGLLAELIRLEGKVQSREALLRNVWGYEHAGSNTVEAHVRRLRRKLGPYACLVETVRGVGYRLKPPGPAAP